MDIESYMVECYWPGVTPEALGITEAEAVRAARGLTEEGTPVKYVDSILVPEDESAFLLFEAPSLAAVEEASRRARIPFARVVRYERPEGRFSEPRE